MAIHRKARGFDTAAQDYERSRPGYPAEAIAWLRERTGAGPGSTIVDLAAGTGKLTRELVPTGARIVAIEPVEGMRAMLERRVPGVDARPATAERTGLPDGFADLVTVAQSFHWFDGPRAVAEIARVMRPDGFLALVWNVRDLTDPVQRAVEDLVNPLRGDTPSHRAGRWRDALDDPAGPLRRVAIEHFRNAIEVDAEGVVSRVASISFIASLPPGERAEVLARARAITEDLPERFPFPYDTEVEVLARR